MPNLNWSKNLNKIQLGHYAENYAMMEFESNGWYVYPALVDDHGVDFVAKRGDLFYEVQVKSIRGNSYTNIQENKMVLSDKFLVCYIRFLDGVMPEVYIFPTTVWNTPNEVFKVRQYKIKEFGINCSKKNISMLEPYKADAFFNSH